MSEFNDKTILGEYSSMTPSEHDLTPAKKRCIDAMTQLELCRMWRFAASGESLLSGKTGEYFKARLDQMGGFTPGISKALGWNR